MKKVRGDQSWAKECNWPNGGFFYKDPHVWIEREQPEWIKMACLALFSLLSTAYLSRKKRTFEMRNHPSVRKASVWRYKVETWKTLLGFSLAQFLHNSMSNSPKEKNSTRADSVDQFNAQWSWSGMALGSVFSSHRNSIFWTWKQHCCGQK